MALQARFLVTFASQGRSAPGSERIQGELRAASARIQGGFRAEAAELRRAGVIAELVSAISVLGLVVMVFLSGGAPNVITWFLSDSAS